MKSFTILIIRQDAAGIDYMVQKKFGTIIDLMLLIKIKSNLSIRAQCEYWGRALNNIYVERFWRIIK